MTSPDTLPCRRWAPGYETNLLYLAALAALVLGGSGPLALGRVWKLPRGGPAQQEGEEA